MKAYRFRLARLLDIRRRALDAAEAELVRALAEIRAAEQRAASLERESSAMALRSTEKTAWPAGEMAAAESYRESLIQQGRKVAAVADRVRASIPELQEKIRLARVGVKALESLDERRRREWKQAADREEEALASELSLARWMRSKR